jgi:hypothetical protein
MRWKCGSCDEVHVAHCLDISFNAPYYWRRDYEEANRRPSLLSSWSKNRETFLSEDYCAISDTDFFVRGVIPLPILGAAKTFCWGVWGSVSRGNFESLLETDDDHRRVELPPMFSWLSTKIPGYLDTLNLKMHARIEKREWRPNFELEPSDHPLSVEYHRGITPERIKEIMSEQSHC